MLIGKTLYIVNEIINPFLILSMDELTLTLSVNNENYNHNNKTGYSPLFPIIYSFVQAFSGYHVYQCTIQSCGKKGRQVRKKKVKEYIV